MPDQQPTSESCGRKNDAHEETVLMLLTDADNPRPWSVNELNLDIGDEIIVADAIANLHASGLLHHFDEGRTPVSTKETGVSAFGGRVGRVRRLLEALTARSDLVSSGAGRTVPR